MSLTIQLFQAGTTNTVTQYTGGTTYDMRVTVNHTAGTPAGHGFQLTCLKQGTNTPLAGYSNLAANVKQKTITSGTYNGRTYCEHNGVSASNQFNFSWTAPAAGSGTVVFYSAGNCVNGTGGDNGDKAGSTTLTITEGVPLSVSGTSSNVLCNGGTTGSINITAVGGGTPYSYSWSDGAITEDRSGLAAGMYTVTVTGLGNATAAASFTLTEPSALAGSISAGTISCNGGTTTIVVSATGGTQPYTGTGSEIVPAGQHSYTISDANGCTANVATTVSQPQALNASATSASLPCAGGNATVTINATGGTQPYTGTGDVSVSTPGTFNYTVTDANGCTATAVATVSAIDGFSVNYVTQKVPCYGSCANSVDITLNGGTAPFTYAWSNGQSTSSVSGLCAGNYAVSISDANGCTVVNNYTFEQLDSLHLTASLTPSSGSNGAIDVTASGGGVPYTYNWSNGSTTEDLADLAAGTYTLTLTDHVGCTATASYAIDVVSGIGNISAATYLLYPNPVAGTLHVPAIGTSGIITIVNAQDETVYTSTYSNAAMQAINVSQLPRAVYYVKIASDTLVLQRSFVKQ